MDNDQVCPIPLATGGQRMFPLPNATHSRSHVHLLLQDKKIEQTVWKVRMFLAPPTDLMNPSLLRKMVTLVVKDRLGFSE